MMTKEERRAVALLTPLPLLKGGGVDGGVEGRLGKGTGGEEGGKAVVGM